jgi:hypothetical protein
VFVLPQFEFIVRGEPLHQGRLSDIGWTIDDLAAARAGGLVPVDVAATAQFVVQAVDVRCADENSSAVVGVACSVERGARAV